MVLRISFALLGHITLIYGIEVGGRIAWNPLLPDITHLSSDSQVTIGAGPQESTYIRDDGSFILQNVGPGKHLLRVSCREYDFLPFMIDVPETVDQVPIVRPHVFGQAPAPVGYPEPQLSYPIRLVATTRLQYTEVKAGFNPISMLLGNPMYLIMGGMAVFMMIMPKLMSMLDPEALAEVQANQASMQKQMASMQDLDFGSGLSKLLVPGSQEDKSDSSPSKPSISVTKSGSGSNTKRRK